MTDANKREQQEEGLADEILAVLLSKGTQEGTQEQKKGGTLKDYYKILGISKNASEEEIGKRYEQLHTDYMEGRLELAQQQALDVEEAGHILLDAKKKAEYDSALSMEEHAAAVKPEPISGAEVSTETPEEKPLVSGPEVAPPEPAETLQEKLEVAAPSEAKRVEVRPPAPEDFSEKWDAVKKEDLTKIYNSKRVYRFKDGEKQYLELQKEVRGGMAHFKVYDTEGKELEEITIPWKRIKHREWKKGAPSEQEKYKEAGYRGEDGGIETRIPLDSFDAEEGRNIHLNAIDADTGQLQEGNYIPLKPEEIVRYEKDGKVMFAKRTEPRPEVGKPEAQPLKEKPKVFIGKHESFTSLFNAIVAKKDDLEKAGIDAKKLEELIGDVGNLRRTESVRVGDPAKKAILEEELAKLKMKYGVEIGNEITKLLNKEITERNANIEAKNKKIKEQREQRKREAAERKAQEEQEAAQIFAEKKSDLDHAVDVFLEEMDKHPKATIGISSLIAGVPALAYGLTSGIGIWGTIASGIASGGAGLLIGGAAGATIWGVFRVIDRWTKKIEEKRRAQEPQEDLPPPGTPGGPPGPPWPPPPKAEPATPSPTTEPVPETTAQASQETATQPSAQETPPVEPSETKPSPARGELDVDIETAPQPPAQEPQSPKAEQKPALAPETSEKLNSLLKKIVEHEQWEEGSTVTIEDLQSPEAVAKFINDIKRDIEKSKNSKTKNKQQLKRIEQFEEILATGKIPASRTEKPKEEKKETEKTYEKKLTPQHIEHLENIFRTDEVTKHLKKRELRSMSLSKVIERILRIYKRLERRENELNDQEKEKLETIRTVLNVIDPNTKMLEEMVSPKEMGEINKRLEGELS